MGTDWHKVQTEYLETGISLKALAAKHGVGQKALGRLAASEEWAKLKRVRMALDAVERQQSMHRQTSTRKGGAAPRQSAESGKTAMQDAENANACAARARHRYRTPNPQGTGSAKGSKTNQSAAMRANPEGALSEEERRAKLAAIRDQLMAQLARATAELDKQVLLHKRKTREIVYDGLEARSKPMEETTQEEIQMEIVDATVNCMGLQRLSATLKTLSGLAREGGGDAQSVELVARLMQKLDGDAQAGGKA